MLRIQQQTDAKAARSYYRSRGEYYLGLAQELPSTWGGLGAARLGLVGEVEQPAFDALCENRLPGGGRLTARNRANRTVGYDFNFHCPKSLSLLFCLSGDAAILTAFRAALAATLAEMEQAMQTRVRKAGAMADRVTGNMLWSEHVHLTARPVAGVPDPHLHAHAFVFNATFDKVEGQWKASKLSDIYREAPYYQALFHGHLAKALADRGYPLERTASGWEVVGLSGLLPKFSRRTEGIERLAAERGIVEPAQKDRLGAETRGRKRDDLSMAELRRLWLARLDVGERQTLAEVASAARGNRSGCTRPGHGRPSPSGSLDRAVAAAIERGFAGGSALVSETRLVAAALTEGLGSLTASQVRASLPAHGLACRDYDGRRFWHRRDARSKPTAAELRLVLGNPSPRTDRDPASLPPGLAERQRSNLHLVNQRRQVQREAEEAFDVEPSPSWSRGR